MEATKDYKKILSKYNFTDELGQPLENCRDYLDLLAETSQCSQITQAELVDRVVALLNDLLERDRPAVAALLANRVPCNTQLAEHPTVQVIEQHGGFHVGLLGILNGLCGICDDGTGAIQAVFEDVNLIHFMVSDSRLKTGGFQGN